MWLCVLAVPLKHSLQGSWGRGHSPRFLVLFSMFWHPIPYPDKIVVFSVPSNKVRVFGLRFALSQSQSSLTVLSNVSVSWPKLRPVSA